MDCRNSVAPWRVVDRLPSTTRLLSRRVPITPLPTLGLLVVIAAALGGGGCAARATAVQPAPRPFPTAGGSSGTEAHPLPPALIPDRRGALLVTGGTIAQAALRFLGTPYRWGGEDPVRGFDCSGLVHYVYSRFGIRLPRDVESQFAAPLPRVKKRKDVQPGDLLFFHTDRRGASHVALALNTHQFVHAPNSDSVVRVEDFDSRYWRARYLGARRVLDGREYWVRVKS